MPLFWNLLLQLLPFPTLLTPTTNHLLPTSLPNPNQLKTLTLTITSSSSSAPTPLQNQNQNQIQIQDPFSICFPSVTNANIYYSKSKSFNFDIIFDDEEPQEEEDIIQSFLRESRRDGLIRECRRRMFFENEREKKKRKSREAAIKYKRFRWRFKAEDVEEAESIEERRKKEEEEEDSDDDNWELPPGGVPY